MNAVETDSRSRQRDLMLYVLSVLFVLGATCFKAVYQAVVRCVTVGDDFIAGSVTYVTSYLCVCKSVCISECVGDCVCVYLSVCASVCLSVCLSA